MKMKHVFLIGAKSLGAYGGYKTFINKLTEYHQNDNNIKYHVACKANGQGAKRPQGAKETSETTYTYHNADCYEIKVPEFIGSAQAIYYDCKSLSKCIDIIKRKTLKIRLSMLWHVE
jgi:rhamnosyltransferase